MHELQGMMADEIASAYPQISMADIYAALAYFWDHRDEMLAEMKAEDEFVAEMRAKASSISGASPDVARTQP